MTAAPERAEVGHSRRTYKTRVVVSAALVTLAAVMLIADEMIFADRIFPGVSIGPVNVGWMKPDDASAAVSRQLRGTHKMSLFLPKGTKQVRVRGRDLGIDPAAAADEAYQTGRVGDLITRLDARFAGLRGEYVIEPHTQPKGSARAVLAEMRRVFARPAVDSRFVLRDGRAQVTRSRPGTRLDVQGGAVELADAFLENRSTAHLPIIRIDPGVTTAKAMQFQSQVDKWTKRPVQLRYRGYSVHLSRNDIAALAMVRSTRLAVDETVLAVRLTPITRKLVRKPTEAQLAVSGDRVRITGGRPGQTVDPAQTALALSRALNAGTAYSQIAVRPIQPLTTRGDLAGMNIHRLLSTFTTRFRLGMDGRDVNINLAAKAVRGKVLAPGQIFSLNRATGPRDRSTGYKEALIFRGGRVVPGIGGGVCQVSSTLYDAALLANLRIIARSNHSMAVTYIPPGRDATAFYPTIDLEFQNTTGRPILLWSDVTGNRLTMQVYGSGRRPRVQIYTTVRKTVPAKTLVAYSRSLRRGARVVEVQGRPGYVVSSYRWLWQGKNGVRREFLATDKYAPRNTVVRVGM